MADSYRLIARESREVDLTTAEGRRARDNDIDRLYRLLIGGLTSDYIDSDLLEALGIVGGEVCREPEELCGQFVREPEEVVGQFVREPDEVCGQIAREPEDVSLCGQICREPEEVGGEIAREPEEVGGEVARWEFSGIGGQIVREPRELEGQVVREIEWLNGQVESRAGSVDIGGEVTKNIEVLGGGIIREPEELCGQISTGPSAAAAFLLEHQEVNVDTALTLASPPVTYVDAAGAPVTISLPPAATANKVTYWIKRLNAGANNVIVDPNGAEIIEFAATATLTVQGVCLTIHCNGVEWMII